MSKDPSSVGDALSKRLSPDVASGSRNLESQPSEGSDRVTTSNISSTEQFPPFPLPLHHHAKFIYSVSCDMRAGHGTASDATERSGRSSTSRSCGRRHQVEVDMPYWTKSKATSVTFGGLRKLAEANQDLQEWLQITCSNPNVIRVSLRMDNPGEGEGHESMRITLWDGTENLGCIDPSHCIINASTFEKGRKSQV